MTQNTNEDTIQHVCDLGYLSELMGGKKHLILDILDAFLIQIPEELSSLTNAITRKDTDNIKHIAHTMKSSVSIAGITVLTPILKEMEEQAKTAFTLDRIKELNLELNVICKRALEEIEAARPNYI